MADPTHIETPPEEKQGAIGGYGPAPFLTLRSALGGTLMGLANLVPGISGGTMLLASGVYPNFIRAISEVSRLKFNRRSLWVLFVVILAAILSIVLLAGPVRAVVVDFRWATFSLFIGLTLGGVPVVWSLARPADKRVWVGALLGFLPMAILAWYQTTSPPAGESEGFFLYLAAGVAGASAMILPGVSGGYLLLVMGVYLPLLGAIDAFKEALRAGDLGTALGPATGILLPVGIGVIVGVVVVSNLLERLLERHEKVTLGVLLGFLLGSVVGLWPFERFVPPVVGETWRGQVMTRSLIADLDPAKYPTEYFSPSGGDVAGALGLVLVGFAVTALVAKFGERTSEQRNNGRDPLSTLG